MLHKIREWFGSLDELDKIIFVFVFILIIIAVCSIGLYFYVFWGIISENQSFWGMFGDYVGGFSGMLISFVAVLLIFITYRLQQRELTETRKALNTQNQQIKIQHFQDILFQLLERKDHLIENIEHQNNTGINALREMNQFFDGEYQNRINENIGEETARNRTLERYWGNFYRRLHPYLNAFTSTIAFLDNFEPINNHQENAKDQLIRIYSANFTTIEKRTLNLLLEYHEVHDPENEEINACRETVMEVGILG